MVQFYRGANEKFITRRTPSAEYSNFDLVIALRRTQGVEENIIRVLEEFAWVTRRAMYHSLLELTVSPSDAIIAMTTAEILGDQSTALKRASSVVASSPYPSDVAQRIANQHIKEREPRMHLLGRSAQKVQNGNGKRRYK